jgi:hypothetical protein
MLVRLLRYFLGQALSPFRPCGPRGVRRPRRRRGICRPCVERLESRLTPAGDFGFAFALSGPHGLVQSNAVATDRAGNVYVTGLLEGTADFDPGPGVANLSSTNAALPDVFVAAYTRAGALLWAHLYGGVGDSDIGNGIAVDDAGDVYVTGSFQGTAGFGPGPGTLISATPRVTSAFVLKLDGAGNFLWARQFTGTGDVAGTAIAVDFAGNVFTTGSFDQTADFDPGPGVFSLTIPGFRGYFLSKLDTGGNFLWAKQFFGVGGGEFGSADSLNAINGIAVDSVGDVYTTGTFLATADFDPGPGTFNLTSNPSSGVEAFVSKLDAGGNFVWAKGFATTSTSGDTTGHSIAVDRAGNAYVATVVSGTADFDPGPGTFSLTSAGFFGDSVLVKLDSAGNFVWAKQFAADQSGNSGTSSVALDGMGNVYAAGRFTGTVDFDPGPGTFDLTSTSLPDHGEDGYVTKLDGAGNFLWARQFRPAVATREGTGDTAANTGIAVDGQGDIYSTGVLIGTVDFDPGPGTFDLSSDPVFPGSYVSKLLDTPAGTPLPPSPSVQDVFVNSAWAGLAPGTHPNGSGPATAIGVDAFASLQPALNAAASGGTVHVAAGTYTGPLVLYKRVNLVGAGSASTVLAGQGTGTGLDITAPGVEISGLTVRGFGAALFASGPAYLALSDVPLTGNATGANVSGVQTLLIAGGPGDDDFFVTPAMVARQGENAIGYSGVRSLTVDGGGGSNTLNVFLNDISTPDTVWLTAGGIARDTAPFLLFYRDTGGTLGGGVAVVLGDGPEAVVVQGQLPGTPTAVYAEGGDDGFWVLASESSGYAGLTLDGGAGTNGVAVLDQSGGAVLRDLGPVIGEGVLQVSYPDGAVSNINYQNINEFLGGLPVTTS